VPNVEVKRSDRAEGPTVQELEEEGLRVPEEPAQPTSPTTAEDLPLKKALEIIQRRAK
jgi:hypothetical protein